MPNHVIHANNGKVCRSTFISTLLHVCFTEVLLLDPTGVSHPPLVQEQFMWDRIFHPALKTGSDRVLNFSQRILYLYVPEGTNNTQNAKKYTVMAQLHHSSRTFFCLSILFPNGEHHTASQCVSVFSPCTQYWKNGKSIKASYKTFWLI